MLPHSIMDYDRTDIPAGYDRGRDHGPELLDLWMHAIASRLEVSPARILDLGCGTGRFSDALAVHFETDVFGVDPSVQMLTQARAKRRHGSVCYQLAHAEAIPLRAKSIDVIFMSMSFHHFRDRWLAARECRRVLREHGSVFVRTGTREQIRAYPYFPFFPASHRILEEVLPDCTTVRRIFEAAGFRTFAHDVITQTIAPNWQTYADKLDAGADSVLARLDRADFASGVAAIRQHSARAGEQAIIEPIDLFAFRA